MRKNILAKAVFSDHREQADGLAKPGEILGYIAGHTAKGSAD
jgi:hypothetical protein